VIPATTIEGAAIVITDEVRARREKVVLDHFADEVRQDWDSVLSTFPHDTRVAFPDQHHEMIALRHSHDAVIVEFYLLGTHLGPLGPVPPTGGTFKVRMTAYFVFDENENLVTERIYFDQLTLLRQLLGGIDMKSPKGLLQLLKVLRGFAKMSREPKDVIPDTPARLDAPAR
jgi:predicted ester cyclase